MRSMEDGACGVEATDREGRAESKSGLDGTVEGES